MDVAAIRRYGYVRRADLVAAVVGIAAVVLFGPLPGLGISITVALLAIIYRSSSPRIEVLGKISDEKAAWGRVRRHPDRRPVDGVIVVRLDAPLFWANATAIEDRLLAEVSRWPDPRALVLDLEATTQLDTTAADVLTHLAGELDRRGIRLYLARALHRVEAVLERSGFFDVVSPDNSWHSISQCVRAARRDTGLKGDAVSESRRPDPRTDGASPGTEARESHDTSKPTTDVADVVEGDDVADEGADDEEVEVLDEEAPERGASPGRRWG